MLIRNQQEELERSSLSPYAALSSETLGRARPEEPCPLRTEFQRDRDRILHCKAFRRLKHKTQVFIDPDEDHFRTRLTHTLEVSQIARTVARALRLNEDLTEAISLGHDLGHTPFGHSGERALDEVYRKFVPGEGFKHNRQSLRVVDLLERDGVGLNLTREVRDGILRHSKGSRDVRFNRDPEELTLEGQIVRISDRIAYINHDIDDAVRAGTISESDLPGECIAILGCGHSSRISTMVIDLVECSMDKPELNMSPRVLSAMNELKDFLFLNVYGPNAAGPLVEELRRAARLVKELFKLYVESPEKLPEGWSPASDSLEDRARTACDFIAGMTDRYAQLCYAEHFMPESFRSI
jgi:dGTPase